MFEGRTDKSAAGSRLGGMKIEDHLLFACDGTPMPRQLSPNHGGPVEPELLVMHFTAGRSAERSIQWLTKAWENRI